MNTILVVDDEQDILDLLRYNLEKEGFRVLTAPNGKKGLALARSGVDLVVLDVMMPEMDGWEVCRQLLADPSTAAIPVVFLTAKDSEVDEVVGLELGAHDYIVKPVKVRTFVARVKKALRAREAEHEAGQLKPIQVRGLTIHPHNYIVTVDGQDVTFPKKEFEVLLFLVRHPDRVISREVLLNEIWGRDVVVIDRTVDVHIRKIREKLGRHASLIETVKGVGYRFTREG
jgi:two-component system alkaline phosphatase synthesis response regulator PhoP